MVCGLYCNNFSKVYECGCNFIDESIAIGTLIVNCSKKKKKNYLKEILPRGCAMLPCTISLKVAH